jgi:hypothetical protein
MRVLECDAYDLRRRERCDLRQDEFIYCVQFIYCVLGRGSRCHGEGAASVGELT